MYASFAFKENVYVAVGVIAVIAPLIVWPELMVPAKTDPNGKAKKHRLAKRVFIKSRHFQNG
jgi:hypothetical protein